MLPGKLSPHRVLEICKQVSKLQDFIFRMNKLEVTRHEYAYLKAITLFTTGLTELFSLLFTYSIRT